MALVAAASCERTALPISGTRLCVPSKRARAYFADEPGLGKTPTESCRAHCSGTPVRKPSANSRASASNLVEGSTGIRGTQMRSARLHALVRHRPSRHLEVDPSRLPRTSERGDPDRKLYVCDRQGQPHPLVPGRRGRSWGKRGGALWQKNRKLRAQTPPASPPRRLPRKTGPGFEIGFGRNNLRERPETPLDPPQRRR